jgi:hypothetical protein
VGSSTLSSSTHPSSDPSALSEAFQAFYATIEEDLRASDRPLFGRRKEEKRSTPHSPDDSSVSETLNPSEDSVEYERKGNNHLDSETRIREILEQIESVMCCTFYDRFVVSLTTSFPRSFLSAFAPSTFCPLSGDDASHDDALANRIAALNMLDLGLEHLGVEIPSESFRSDVHYVVKACGESE